MQAGFVGRSVELSTISDALRGATRHDRPTLIVVEGPPGQGKSRLISEIRATLLAKDVLSMAGYELEREVPLAAASELLRTVAARPSGEALRELLSGTAGGLAPLDPIRVLEAVHTGVKGQSITIFLDDLQWADSLSLALIGFLLRSSTGALPVRAIVVAARPGPHVTDLLAAAGADADTLVLDLGPMERADGIDLARSLAPDLDPPTAEAAWAEAAGSPFWLEVVVRSLVQTPTPASRLDASLAGLDTVAVEVLTAVAVAGRPCRIDDIGTVLGSPTSAVEAAATRLERRGLLTRVGGELALAHDLVREAALARLPTAGRRSLQLGWARVLESTADDDVQTLRAALAYRSAAGAAQLAVALRLAGSSRRCWLGSEGLAELERVAGELDAGGAFSSELEEAIARLATELDLHEVGLRRYARVAERAGDDGGRPRAELGAARSAYRLARADTARAWLARIDPVASNDPAVAIGTIALDALIAIFLEHRPEAGWKAAERATALAGRHLALVVRPAALPSATRASIVDAFQAAAIAALQRDDPAGMLLPLEQIRALTADVDEAAHLSALVLSSMASRLQGRTIAAAELSRRVWDEGQRRMLPIAAMEGGAWLAVNLIDLGRLAEAETVVAQVAAVAKRVTGFNFYSVGRSRLVPHELAALRGPWRPAVRTLLDEVAHQPDPHSRLGYHEWLMVWLARVDPHAEGAVLVEIADGRREAAEARCPRCATELELHASEALVRLGKRDEALDALARWDAKRPRPNGREGPIRRWIGALILGWTDATAAIADIDRLAREAEHDGRLLAVAWLAWDRARLLQSADRPAAAYREAATLAAGVGARTLLEMNERALRSLGARTWRRAKAGEQPAGLTDRELEVATLIASGATNPEIADAMFLARKTVERHVSNVLAKTGARNRTELAARIRELVPTN